LNSKTESLPFGYQFAEVEKAIANFTKHQPFNHHYAPNANVNRNHNNNHHHNHHHNNTNNGNGNNNGNNNRFNNYNYNNGNNNRYHQKQQQQQQQQFSMNAQLKQQQQQHHLQQFPNNNVRQLQRFKQLNNVNIHQQQQPPHQAQNAVLQQQFQQFQAHPTMNYQQQLQPQVPTQVQGLSLGQPGMINGNGNDLKYDFFQSVQPQFTHSELMNPLRNTSPTLASPMRPGSSNTFGNQLEHVNSPGSTFGLNSSDFLNTPLTNVSSSNGEIIDNKLSLDDSTAYLGDIWGNSKSSLRNSSSVWA
jgi:hypothetical protein